MGDYGKGVDVTFRGGGKMGVANRTGGWFETNPYGGIDRRLACAYGGGDVGLGCMGPASAWTRVGDGGVIQSALRGELGGDFGGGGL